HAERFHAAPREVKRSANAEAVALAHGLRAPGGHEALPRMAHEQAHGEAEEGVDPAEEREALRRSFSEPDAGIEEHAVEGNARGGEPLELALGPAEHVADGVFSRVEHFLAV